MIKTFQYRLYPSKTQERSLDATKETCRRWYNSLLADRKMVYDGTGESLSKYDQLKGVKHLKAENPWAKNIHSHILQVVVADLDKTFQAFFRRLKADIEKPGFPRFKGRNRFDSFGLKEYGNGFKIDGRRLRVSGIGRIPVRWHRPLEGKIKTLRLIKKASGWYASFNVETEPHVLPVTSQDVGVDVGITNLLTTSDDVVTPQQGWYHREQAALRILQRRVSRRTKGGSNRWKAVHALRRQHERIASQRRDFLNKQVNTLVQSYDRIAVEDLKITNMVKNKYFAKSILDASWGYFMQTLRTKAEEAGRVVIKVNPAFTSQDCSTCGHRGHLTLEDRRMDCPCCGLSLDRDHNAAINILKRAGHVRWNSSAPMGALFQEAAGL